MVCGGKRWASVAYRRVMVFWGLGALLGLELPFASQSSSHLVFGLAVVVAALLVVVAAASGLRLAALPAGSRAVAVGRRARVRRLPRLLDPAAAGRPRPRAPTRVPAVFGPAVSARLH